MDNLRILDQIYEVKEILLDCALCMQSEIAEEYLTDEKPDVSKLTWEYGRMQTEMYILGDYLARAKVALDRIYTALKGPTPCEKKQDKA